MSVDLDERTYPEPEVPCAVLGSIVPVAESWARGADSFAINQVRQMLAALPGRRLTRIVGHDDGWYACTEGADHDGYTAGSWIIRRPEDRSPMEEYVAELEAELRALRAVRDAALILRAEAECSVPPWRADERSEWAVSGASLRSLCAALDAAERS